MEISRRSVKPSVTAGLKCAPEIGPNIVIRTTRIAPVGMVLPRRATATSSVKVSAMMPEPTTVQTKNPVPKASAVRRRDKSYCGMNSSSLRCRLLVSGTDFRQSFL